jgi:hypothetical protein
VSDVDVIYRVVDFRHIIVSEKREMQIRETYIQSSSCIVAFFGETVVSEFASSKLFILVEFDNRYTEIRVLNSHRVLMFDFLDCKKSCVSGKDGKN